eukprot:12879876-Prorocentrum_lima.AAC.1
MAKVQAQLQASLALYARVESVIGQQALLNIMEGDQELVAEATRQSMLIKEKIGLFAMLPIYRSSQAAQQYLSN